MLNHVTVAGRLTHSPELRKTQSDLSVVSFSIACDDDLKDKTTGERKTNFFNVTAWRHTADFVAKYVPKGALVMIDGKLTQREWTGKDGSKKNGVEIVAENVYFAEKKRDGDPAVDTNKTAPAAAEPAPAVQEADEDGELPF